MKTELLENIYKKLDNVDCVLNYNTSLMKDFRMQKNTLNRIALWDNKLSGIIPNDNAELIYIKKDKTTNKYSDDTNREGYEYIYNFTEDEFAGEISTVSLVHDDFIDITKTGKYETMIGGSGVYTVKNNDALTGFEKVLDVNYDENYLLTFSYNYDANDGWNITLKRFNHNFNRFRLSGSGAGFLYLKDVINVDITELFEDITNTEKANFYYGKDEKNNKYVLSILTNNRKINTAIIDCEDLTNIEIYKMNLQTGIEPIYKEWKMLQGEAVPALIYKGRLCFLFNVEKSAEEDEISGVYMCSMDYRNSTDIKTIKTVLADGYSQYPNHALINSGCGSVIAGHHVIKNDVAYIHNNGTDFGFFNKGLMLIPQVKRNGENVSITFIYRLCPYLITIYNNPTNPILKPLNKTLKLTYRIVNS